MNCELKKRRKEKKNEVPRGPSPLELSMVQTLYEMFSFFVDIIVVVVLFIFLYNIHVSVNFNFKRGHFIYL